MKSQLRLKLFLLLNVTLSDQTVKLLQLVDRQQGFVVLEGSMIELTDGKGIPKSIRDLRQELLKEGIIKDGILKKNRFSIVHLVQHLLF